jgi:hypothetical protein
MCLIYMGCKMIEYCEQAAAYEEDPSPSVQPGGIDTRLPLYMSLAGKYGLDDNDNMDIGKHTATEQTVKQEYQSYITSLLSPKKTDIIKFWEASNTTGIL